MSNIKYRQRSCSIRTDTMKLIVVFRNFTQNARKKTQSEFHANLCKTEFKLKYIKFLKSYRAVNKFLLGNKIKQVKAVQGNNLCLF
jgi:hypothetical protein